MQPKQVVLLVTQSTLNKEQYRVCSTLGHSTNTCPYQGEVIVVLEQVNVMDGYQPRSPMQTPIIQGKEIIIISLGGKTIPHLSRTTINRPINTIHTTHNKCHRSLLTNQLLKISWTFSFKLVRATNQKLIKGWTW